ncbi:hypothetical protein NQ318_005950 [Aromia moschata]|uniref:Uncharacterized protein n=1 Tax=Aromia moschata TaxID=1265417 RepID=A0AAV8YDT6_9CUCU|nr:hypothetical protein NQ318_005950 [Aromia moschata]
MLLYEVNSVTGYIAPDLATLRRREERFCFRLEHSATDTFSKLQHAYGDSVFSIAQPSDQKNQHIVSRVGTGTFGVETNN